MNEKKIMTDDEIIDFILEIKKVYYTQEQTLFMIKLFKEFKRKNITWCLDDYMIHVAMGIYIGMKKATKRFIENDIFEQCPSNYDPYDDMLCSKCPYMNCDSNGVIGRENECTFEKEIKKAKKIKSD
jgi:hypothetical protein